MLWFCLSQSGKSDGVVLLVSLCAHDLCGIDAVNSIVLGILKLNYMVYNVCVVDGLLKFGVWLGVGVRFCHPCDIDFLLAKRMWGTLLIFCFLQRCCKCRDRRGSCH